MNEVQQLLTDHMDIWTAAETEKRSGRGRASGNAASMYGIKKLRELILELAVRGNLVPQDTNDESVSELLKRIQIEKAKLITEGKIRKEKSFDPISSEEIPFQLPQAWKWVRIGQIGHDWGQKLPDRDFTYIEVSAIDNQRGVISSAELMAAENAPSRARKLVKNGTLIYSTIRPYLLNIAVVEEDFSPEPIASTAFAVVHPFCAMPSRYFLFFLRSPVFVRYVESVQMGIAYPAINDRQFFSGLIPLPPIEEQHRIVAKVDELMALCDHLEAQHSCASVAHEQLVSHLLGTLTQSQSAADFNTSWQRIAAHFDTLFTTEASIDALKQTLLQLAVMGKLVAQDPNDEPAIELLKQIQVEKAKLIVEGKIKKSKSLAAIADKDKPFLLPLKWQWARFPDLGEFGRGKSKHRPRNDPILFSPEIHPLIQTGEVARAENIIAEYHSKYSDIGLAQSKMWPIGTLCITIAANIADSAILGFDACFPDSVVGFIPFEPIKDTKYFLTFMKTARQNLLKFAPATAQKNINLEILESVLIPIPPLAEMTRIVEKIEELMRICDHLKSRITEASQKQKELADVLVAHAVKG